ncbi:MAG: hypothetical protein EOP49_48985 [Sphingobacteriales bacterium]|nr:MAG: hypothetical protein EOP49_48985 [Sphingobacteriales bacterium]
MAHILESTEIRRLWPIYNRSQRGYVPQYGLFLYEDQKGYKRLAVEKHKPIFKPVYTFNTITEGHQRLRELIKEFGLCPRLCNLAKSMNCELSISLGDCSGNCAGTIEAYNERVEQAIAWLDRHLPTFAYLDKGLTENERSCILVRKGNLFGMGYIQGDAQPGNLEKLQQQLEPLQDNDFIRNLIYKHAATNPDKCIHLV